MNGAQNSPAVPYIAVPYSRAHTAMPIPSLHPAWPSNQ